LDNASPTSSANNLTDIGRLGEIDIDRGDNSSENQLPTSASPLPMRSEPDGTLQTGFSDRLLVTSAPIHGNQIHGISIRNLFSREVSRVKAFHYLAIMGHQRPINQSFRNDVVLITLRK
jgi:hypothetical protein